MRSSHNVEEKYKHEIYTKTEKIRLWSLGPVHNDSTIIALSEIAAMAFAKEITGIPYAPMSWMCSWSMVIHRKKPAGFMRK